MADVKSLWRGQKTEETVTLEDIRNRATKFQRRVRNRNLREYAAAALAVLIFSAYIWVLPGLMVKGGSALCIAGVLYVVWQLHRRGSAQAVPAEATAAGLLDFHRQALVRQRDAVRSVWRWYLGPPLPGMIVMLAAVWYNAAPAARTGRLVIVLAATVALIVFTFGTIWWLNAYGAKKLQQRIDEIDRLRQDR